MVFCVFLVFYWCFFQFSACSNENLIFLLVRDRKLRYRAAHKEKADKKAHDVLRGRESRVREAIFIRRNSFRYTSSSIFSIFPLENCLILLRFSRRERSLKGSEPARWACVDSIRPQELTLTLKPGGFPLNTLQTAKLWRNIPSPKRFFVEF